MFRTMSYRFYRLVGIKYLTTLVFVLALMCGASASAQTTANASDPHGSLMSEESYPSANQCSVCHQKIYKEWASSNHAYSSISPMFHKFEQKIYDLTKGTIGSFCVRCHQTVGTQMSEPRETPLWERSQVSREGVTCITCHRVNEQFGKVNGERSIVAGDINAPVYNSGDGSGLEEVLKRKGELKIATDKTERGTQGHAKVIKFPQISSSEFCSSCHQVAVNLGIKLEVVWEQYRASPAAKEGVTCQACHMGKVPGVDSGYEKAPVAVINGVEINPNRDHHNHSFYGPGTSIAHPGIFPHNVDAASWEIRDWLKFDWRSGWGSEEFEESIEAYSEAFEGIDEALETIGASTQANAFSVMDESLATLASRLADTGRMVLPIKEAQDAHEALSDVLDAEFDEDAAQAILEGLVQIADAVEEDKKEKATNAIKNIQATLKTFKGIWTEKSRAENIAAIHETIGTILTDLGAAKNVETANALYTEASQNIQKLQILAASGISFHSQIWALKVILKVDFPPVWADIDDREDAHEVVAANLKELEIKRELKYQVMANGSKLDGPFFSSVPGVGKALSLSYLLENTNNGHNLPSGSLGAQPEIWMNVALINPNGKNVWESGYVDSNGDFADVHSLDLAAGKIEHDSQLFNLQTKFLTTNVKGTDREMYLPVNLDVDQLPHLRPPGQPTTVINHPPFVRMEGRSIPPLGNRAAKYTIPESAFETPGKYRLAVRVRSRSEPIYFMKFVEATDPMIQSMNERMVDIHPYTVEFDVK